MPKGELFPLEEAWKCYLCRFVCTTGWCSRFEKEVPSDASFPAVCSNCARVHLEWEERAQSSK